MINSKFTLKKFLKLEGTILFYSIGILMLFSNFIDPIGNIDIKTIIRSLLPLLFSMYWFATCYIVLMFISPFLNYTIKTFTKKHLQKLIITLIILWCLIPTFLKTEPGYSQFVWFVTLYLIASYTKLYFPHRINIKKHLFVAVISIIILLGSVVTFNIIGNFTGISLFLDKSIIFLRENNLLILIISIELFLVFLGIKPFYSKFINIIGCSTFGVYLIHDNYLMRAYLWKTIFRNSDYYHSKYLILHAICTIIIVYIGCTVIEIIRQNTFEKIWMIYVDKFVIKNINIYLSKFKYIVNKITVKISNFYSE